MSKEGSNKAKRREEAQLEQSRATLRKRSQDLRKAAQEKYLLSNKLRTKASQLFDEAEEIDQAVSKSERRKDLRSLLRIQPGIIDEDNDNLDQDGLHDIDTDPLYHKLFPAKKRFNDDGGLD